MKTKVDTNNYDELYKMAKATHKNKKMQARLIEEWSKGKLDYFENLKKILEK